MAELNKEDLFSQELLKAPYELAKGLGLVVEQIDRITEASKQSETVLKSSNSAGKIAKETNQLTIQEKELLKVQNQISVALAKNNDEYIEHKRGLDAINRAVKEKIQKGREDLTFTGQMKNAMKDLKNELKEAKNAMLLAADAGGTMSKEYQDAAKQAGEIADKIGDAKDEAKVFANDTAFGALGTRVGLLKDKMMSLDFKGAGEQLKGLGKIILANPLLILAAVVTGIVVGLVALKDSIPFVSAAFTKVSEVIDYVVGKLKAFSDWLGISTFAAQDKAKEVIKASNAETAAIEKNYDHQIALAQAAGKETVALETKKWQDIKAAAEKGQKAAYDPKKALEEQSEEYKKFSEQIINASNAIEIIEAKNHEASKKRREEFLKHLDELSIKNRDAIEAAAQEKIKKQQRHEAELERMVEHAEKIKENQEIELEQVEQLDAKYASLTALRAAREKEAAAKRQAAYEKDLEVGTNTLDALTSAIDDSLRSNDQSFKHMLKSFLVSMLRQVQVSITTQLLAGAAARAALAVVPGAGALILARAAREAIVIKALFSLAQASILKFEKGTDSAPGGLAYVGEKGRELIITPSGHVSLSPNKATLTNLPKGSQVIPNEETMRILASNTMRGISSTKSGDFILYGKLSSLENTIRETNEKIAGAVDRSNGKIFNHGSLIYEMKVKDDGSKKMIRRKSLSA